VAEVAVAPKAVAAAAVLVFLVKVATAQVELLLVGPVEADLAALTVAPDTQAA
jgi:hypothetical protein